MFVGGGNNHKNHEGGKHEGRRIRPTIGDLVCNCASNQSPFNNWRVDELEERMKVDTQLPTIKLFYSKVLINNKVTNRKDSHILLFKPRRQEVQEFYDLKRNIYILLWEGKRIAMISSKEQVHVPMAEVKIEENILKIEVVEEHVENIKDLQVCELHEDKIANLVVSTKEVVVLKNCENKVLGSKDEERVEVLIIGEVNQDSNMDLD
ncbi:hypothetical protein Tco_0602505 [Tanacetum coccineum]